jgi:hypothetical protein
MHAAFWSLLDSRKILRLWDQEHNSRQKKAGRMLESLSAQRSVGSGYDFTSCPGAAFHCTGEWKLLNQSLLRYAEWLLQFGLPIAPTTG